MKTTSLIVICILVFAYLCGAFYSASFEISHWEEETRLYVIIFGVFIALAYVNQPNSNNR